MTGFVYALDLGNGEVAIDFNEALGGEGEKSTPRIRGPAQID